LFPPQDLTTLCWDDSKASALVATTDALAAKPEQGQLLVWRSPCSVYLRTLLLSWVCRSFEGMSTDQQERGDFAVPWHQFSLSGRWTWFERAFKRETRGGECVEIGAEHTVIVSDPATYPDRAIPTPLREPEPFIEIASDNSTEGVLRVSKGDPLGLRGLETGVRNDTDTAFKLAVAQPVSALSISLKIHNPQRLLLFIASCERQQVRCQVKTGDLCSVPCQLARHPALPAGQITNDFPLYLSDKRQQVRQNHFCVDRSPA
jgi:hypothetical protein